MNRLLNGLGIASKKLRLQCIDAGLVGYISEIILKPGQILLSDRAGQFAVFNHAACWGHMERPLRKLKTTSSEAENELEQVLEKWFLKEPVNLSTTIRSKYQAYE